MLGCKLVVETDLIVCLSPDGQFQLEAGRWPLYRYAGDSGVGDVYGQGSGGTWFAVIRCAIRWVAHR